MTILMGALDSDWRKHAPISAQDDTSVMGRTFEPVQWRVRCQNPLAHFISFVIASAALPAKTQFADPATTASSSNQRNPKSSMHSGKSGLMTMYPGITAPE